MKYTDLLKNYEIEACDLKNKLAEAKENYTNLNAKYVKECDELNVIFLVKYIFEKTN